MKHRIAFINLPFLAIFLALVPTALASNNWYVDGVHGKNKNDCKSPQTACKTIRHAISLVHSGDSIIVAAATYTENLTVGSSLRLVGAGAVTTIIDGGGVDRVITISSATADVTLSGLTIRNGNAVSGGGIFNSGTLRVITSSVSGNLASNSCTEGCGSSGGGIFNSTGATLTISNSTVLDNLARLPCNPWYNYCRSYGGGVFNEGSLIVNNSTFSGNSAGLGGGGIYSSGTVMVSNSTFSGNRFSLGGAGIYSSGGTVTVSNSTFSGNSATFGSCVVGDGLTISSTTLSGNNGASCIRTWSQSTLQNSVVANNSGGNCYGTITSKGYNLSSDNSCDFGNAGDLNNTDPKLGKLGDHGGPTQTMPLLSGSPAIDAGNPSGCTDSHGHLLKTDQRGKPRPDKKSGRCDMGAYERQED